MAASETQPYQPCRQNLAKGAQNAHDTKSSTDPTHMSTGGTAATGISSIRSIAWLIVSDKGCGMNLLGILS